MPATRVKTDIYRDFLPLLTSGRVELLDLPRLISQLCGLERSTGRGRDRIDHPPNQHDDVINSVAGAALMVGARGSGYDLMRLMGLGSDADLPPPPWKGGPPPPPPPPPGAA